MAAWSDEVHGEPIGRKILGDDIAIYRTESGKAAAVNSVCPHRMAPLEYGIVVGENLKCRYHGLEFAPDGGCVVIPSGHRSPNMRTKGYVISERDGVIWLWSGDEGQVVDPPDVMDLRGSHGATIRGHLAIDAHYQLVVDNLMDDAHATHLHAAFKTDAHLLGSNPEVRADGDQVFADITISDTPLVPAFSKFYDKPGNVDQWFNFRWDAPSFVTLAVGVQPVGAPRTEGISTKSVQMITPATETSSHYFWSLSRNCKLEDEELSKMMHGMLSNVFRTEDKWILEGQQRMMGDKSFWDNKPMLLPQDKAAVAVRRRMDTLMAAQAAG
jgi:phenylpropionate dioxygenase-like ring-hydroxylating dioxygenase large terminal subunit